MNKVYIYTQWRIKGFIKEGGALLMVMADFCGRGGMAQCSP